MQLLSEVAMKMGQVAPVTIRINPNVDAKTHSKISTGKKEDKFGIPILRAREVFAMAADLPGLKVVGIDVHIGSQLTELEPYGLAYEMVAELTKVLRADGHEITRLDLGGGLGITYKNINDTPPTPEEYAALVCEKVGHLGCQIEIEPGRFIVGNAGILVSEVIYVKSGEDRNFLIVDGAMNDLIRPAMYGAYHEIVPVEQPLDQINYENYDVVGPVCESGDTFAKGRALPSMLAGDLVAFRSAGAYGAVMASEYNSRPLVPEVMVRGDQFSVIRERPSLDEMINRDILPKWH
jgi:diaminopimelate decarboxylase